MKIAHQVSQEMVGKLTASTAVQAVTFNGLKCPAYREAYSHKVKDNTYLIMLSNGFRPGNEFEFIKMAVDYGVDEIVLPFDELDWGLIQTELGAIREKGIKICASVSDFYWYAEAAKIENLDSIAFDFLIGNYNEGKLMGMGAPAGWDRFRAIHNLVRTGKFDSRKRHRLLGMRNPAEMIAYRRAFSDFIYGSIAIAITSMCFVYSTYGVCLSRENGVYLNPVILPEFNELDDTILSLEQESLYFFNKEIMNDFAGGIGGDRLVRAYGQQARKEHVELSIAFDEEVS